MTVTLQKIDLADAERDFDALLDRVELGECFTIMRGSEPVAHLVPHELQTLKADIQRGIADREADRVKAFDVDRIAQQGKEKL